MKSIIHIVSYNSPCGELELGSIDEKLCMCDWVTEKHHKSIMTRLRYNLNADIEYSECQCLYNASHCLDEYFKGQRTTFDIPLLFIGTEFQKMVWEKLLDIPYGSIESYGALAKRINHPKAVRAVANANGANAISIFVPCHRVIGSNGSPTGYGGGIPAKLFLLNLETKR